MVGVRQGKLATLTQIGRRTVSDPRRYWSIQCVLGAIQFALSLNALEIFGESMLMTALMALAVMFSLVGSAHLLGRFARDANNADRYVGLALGFTSLTALFTIGYLRLRAVSTLGSDPSHVVASAHLLMPGLIFILAVWFSYAAHARDGRMIGTGKRLRQGEQ